MQRRLVPKEGVGRAHRAAQAAKGYVPPGSSAASVAAAVTSATPVATADGCDSEAPDGGAHGAVVPIGPPEEEEDEPCVGVGAGHGGADDENNPQNVGAAPTVEDHAMIDDEDAVAAEGEVATGSRAREDDAESGVLPAKKKPKKKKKKNNKTKARAVAAPAEDLDDDDDDVDGNFEVSHVKATRGPDGEAWVYSARDLRTGDDVRIDEGDLDINAKETLLVLARGRPGRYAKVLLGCRGGGGATGAGAAAGDGGGTSHPNGGACSPSSPAVAPLGSRVVVAPRAAAAAAPTGRGGHRAEDDDAERPSPSSSPRSSAVRYVDPHKSCATYAAASLLHDAGDADAAAALARDAPEGTSMEALSDAVRARGRTWTAQRPGGKRGFYDKTNADARLSGFLVWLLGQVEGLFVLALADDAGAVSHAVGVDCGAGLLYDPSRARTLPLSTSSLDRCVGEGRRFGGVAAVRKLVRNSGC